MNSVEKREDIEKIKLIIEEKNQRFQSRAGAVLFAGVENGTVKISPTGFCRR